MTRKRVEELSVAAQKRMLIAALVRAAVSAALLVVVYYLAPLDRPLDAGTWIEFVLGLVVFASSSPMRRERSSHPTSRVCA